MKAERISVNSVEISGGTPSEIDTMISLGIVAGCTIEKARHDSIVLGFPAGSRAARELRRRRKVGEVWETTEIPGKMPGLK